MADAARLPQAASNRGSRARLLAAIVRTKRERKKPNEKLYNTLEECQKTRKPEGGGRHATSSWKQRSNTAYLCEHQLEGFPSRKVGVQGVVRPSQDVASRRLQASVRTASNEARRKA